MVSTKNIQSLLAVIIFGASISGCSASDAPRKTAETFLGGMTAGYSEAEANMFKNSPHYKQGVDCLTQHLEQSGWSEGDYEKFMELINDTGQLDKVSANLSDAEQMQYFGPLLLSPCL